ncbi:MAG: VanW family protein [Hespellia sp.]|nr:VanW family protein [Hespellia sp.]
MAKQKQRMSTRRRKMQIRKRKIQAIKGGLLLVCILMIYGIIQLVLWNYVSRNTTNAIPRGIYIGETDVSGLSVDEAAKAVDAAVSGYQEASILLQFDENRTLTTSAQELGVTIADEKAVIQKAYNYNRKGSLFKRWRQIRARKKENQVIAIPFAVNAETLTNLLTQKCTPLLKAPVNATLSRENDATVLKDGENGEVIDFEKTIKTVNQFLNKDWKGADGTMAIAVSDEEPEIKSDDLSGIQDLLGTYTTFYSADGTAHAHNVEIGATNVGGRIIASGEEVSVDQALKSRTEENGYEKAGSYESGTVVQTYGGGICQVSTTLYNAVLYAELEVEKRSPHSMRVSYVDPSRDAAIAEGLTDFVFKNSYDTPVYIESVLADGYLTFNIYGKETRDSGRTIDFESEILKTEDMDGTTFVTVNQPIGYFVQIAPYQGMDAQLWKIVYQDGEEVSRDVINTSHYQATKLTYSVGIQSDSAEAVAEVKNAIASQDPSVVQTAVNKALGY